MRRLLAARKRKLAAAGILALAVYALLHAGTGLVVRAPLETPDAILVLGSHEWERLPEAADAARRAPHALVFLTLPRSPNLYNCHDCERRPARLVAAGVSRQRIVELPEKVSNTRDEAAAARGECQRRGVRSLLIVTSPYHTRRALATFRRAFDGSGIAVGVLPSGASPARPARWWLAAYDRAYVRYEWAAIIYYRLRGAA